MLITPFSAPLQTQGQSIPIGISNMFHCFFFPFDWVAQQNLKGIRKHCREKSYETLMTWCNVVSH